MPIINPGFPWLRKLRDFLVARGQYRPQVTTTNTKGETVVVQEEVVEGKGVLRSKTIWASIAGVGGSWVVLKGYFAGGLTAEEAADEVFLGAIATLGASLAAIWAHIRSWMPVRGSPAPPPAGL